MRQRRRLLPREGWARRAAIGLAACCATVAPALPGMVPVAAATEPTPAPTSTVPTQESTRVAKLGALKKLAAAPHTVFFGSSRAMRVSPGDYQAITGRIGFNAAVSSGSIVDAYCFAHYIRERFPGTTQRYVWFLDVEQFRHKTISRVIFAQPELAKFIPAGFPSPYAGQTLTPAPLPGPVPPEPWGKIDVVDPDGWLRWNRYDYWRPRGRTLNKGLAYSRYKYKSIYPLGYPRLYGTPKWFMKRTLTLMDQWGSYPVIVLTPYHPNLHTYITERGYTKRRRQVWNYLKRLQRSGLDFALLDMTTIERFGGWKSGFYDGVHMRTTMSRMLLQRVIARTGDLLR